MNTIKQTLRKEGRTAKWLATQIGKGPDQVYKYMSGYTLPTIDIVIKMAIYLNVSIDELYPKSA